MTNFTRETGPIYLSDVMRCIVQGRIFILAFTVICTLAAGLYAFQSEPIYRANVLFSVVQRGPSSRGVGQSDIFASILSGGMFAQTGSSKFIATLMSQRLSTDFITRENLMPIFFEDSWDEPSNSWKTDVSDDPPSLNDAFKLFDQKIRTTSTDVKAGLITLSIEWSNPVLAASWAEKLIDLANQSLRESAIEEATKSIAYLRAELNKTEIVEVRQAIFTLMEQQMQEIMLANVQDEYAFDVIDPPVVPEKGDFVRPRRLLIMIFGLLAGLIGSSLVVTLRSHSS